MKGYDKWKTAEPPEFWDDDNLGDAEAAMLDARARWRRDNYGKIADLYEDYMDTLREAWANTTRADWDAHAEEYLPSSGIEDEYDAAQHEMQEQKTRQAKLSDCQRWIMLNTKCKNKRIERDNDDNRH